MISDTDILRRSMDAEPAEWLDDLVTERAVAELESQNVPQRRRSKSSRAHVRRWPRPMLVAALRAWAERLLPSGVQLLWRGDQRG